MKKTELKELYEMMFPNYPDILMVLELREMLGIIRTVISVQVEGKMQILE